MLKDQCLWAKNGMLYPKKLLLLCTIDGVIQRHSSALRVLSSRGSQEVEHYSKKSCILHIWRLLHQLSPFSRQNQANPDQCCGHHATIFMCPVIRSLTTLSFLILGTQQVNRRSYYRELFSSTSQS